MSEKEFLLLLLAISCVNYSASVITERQYASMPDLFHLDDFDKCMLYGQDALYCTITFQLYPLNPNNSSQIWRIIEEVSSVPSNYRHDRLRHGICIPTTCPQITAHNMSMTSPNFTKELTLCYNNKFKEMGLKGLIVKKNCQTQESPYPVDVYDIAFAGFILIYLAFVCFASLYEGLARYKTQDEYDKITSTPSGKFISAFSIPKNWYRLQSMNFNDPDIRALRVIQGIRFYNMLCVIMAHTVLVNLSVPISNTLYPENMTKKTMNMFFANGSFVTQTFFLISGWLLTYNFSVYFEGQDKIPVRYLVLAFIKRYLRLTPVLALVIGFHSTWLVHFGRGPIWDLVAGAEYRRCRKNWWTNLLYLNNYVDKENMMYEYITLWWILNLMPSTFLIMIASLMYQEGYSYLRLESASYWAFTHLIFALSMAVSTYGMCSLHTWYLVSEISYFIFGLFLLCLIRNRENRTRPVLTSLIGLQVLLIFTITYWNNWGAYVRPQPETFYSFNFRKMNEWHVLIASPLSHLSGYILGIYYGCLFCKSRKNAWKPGKIVYILWWISIWVICMGILVVPGLIMFSPNYRYHRLFEAIYGSTCKLIFTFTLGYGIYGTTQGLGGMMLWVCNWKPAVILSRLSYSAYLVNITFCVMRIGLLRQPTYLSDYNMFIDYLSDIVSTLSAAFLITLLFELPISELQKSKVQAQSTKKCN